LQIKTKIVSSHTPDSKPVKQEVNSTLILPPLVFPGLSLSDRFSGCLASQPGKKPLETSTAGKVERTTDLALIAMSDASTINVLQEHNKQP
jgi:hypothetical protein